MGKRTVTTLILGALVAGFIAVSAPAASALSSVESCFYNATNHERAIRGKPKLTLKSDLTSVARRHSKWMAEDETIYHADSSSPHYKEGDNLATAVSGNWWALGENVGMGPDCSSIQKAFMASEGHRNNILDKDYNQVGVGVVMNNGTVYVTVDFAGRKSTTTTTTVRRTTTTRTTTARRTTTTRRATPTVAAAKPKPKPKPPAPKPVFRATPRTVSNLIQLVGMDARQVDPATGAAMGI